MTGNLYARLATAINEILHDHNGQQPTDEKREQYIERLLAVHHDTDED